MSRFCSKYRSRNRLTTITAVVAALVCRWAGGEPTTKLFKVDFDQDVAPIFADACIKCHGDKDPQGQLRLDVKKSAFAGGFSGPGVVPGDLAKSEIYQRITATDPDLRMPHKAAPLSAKRILTIRMWIEQGANWPEQQTRTNVVRKHWAYMRPITPVLPQVRNKGWVRNPIDAFILSRLEQEGLSPSPEADKEQLLRRLSLDLTGLPPTLDQIDAFLKDERPDAFDRAVERLLESPHYGERWAQPWLDAARYADSNGFTNDRARTIWPYRDWVIQAYNADMPFDEFTI
jgi:hypothetical protein